MEELLYSIKIHKDTNKNIFLGKIFSDNNNLSEFKNQKIESLLEDMVNSVQLKFDTFSNSSMILTQNKGEK
jgi:hypothetical protein